MTRPAVGSVNLVPGAHNLAGLHERAIPQKDQLCGPFWGALVLSAAGHAASQEEVAFRAGTTLAEGDPSELDEEERRPLGIRPLPGSLGEAIEALESDAVVRSWFSPNLLGVKRTEISLLDGVEPKEACERYLRVY